MPAAAVPRLSTGIRPCETKDTPEAPAELAGTTRCAAEAGGKPPEKTARGTGAAETGEEESPPANDNGSGKERSPAREPEFFTSCRGAIADTAAAEVAAEPERQMREASSAIVITKDDLHAIDQPICYETTMIFLAPVCGEVARPYDSDISCPPLLLLQ
jgi:hypothetical protein